MFAGTYHVADDRCAYLGVDSVSLSRGLSWKIVGDKWLLMHGDEKDARQLLSNSALLVEGLLILDRMVAIWLRGRQHLEREVYWT